MCVSLFSVTFVPFFDEFYLLLVGKYLGCRIVSCRQAAEEYKCLQKSEKNKSNKHWNNLLLEEFDKKSIRKKMIFIHFVEERLFFGKIVGIMSVV